MEHRLETSQITAWSSSTPARYFTDRVMLLKVALGSRLPQWYKRVENNPFTEPDFLSELRKLLAQKGTKSVPESKVAQVIKRIGAVSAMELKKGNLRHRLVERGNAPTIGSRKPDVIGYNSLADGLLTCLPYVAFLGELKAPSTSITSNTVRGQAINFASLLLEQERFRQSVFVFLTNGVTLELINVKAPQVSTSKVQAFIFESVPFFPSLGSEQVCGLDILWNMCLAPMSNLGSSDLPAFASTASYLGTGASSIVFAHDNRAVKVPRKNPLLFGPGVDLPVALEHELSVYQSLADAGYKELFLKARGKKMRIHRDGRVEETLLLELEPVCVEVKAEHVTLKGVRHCLAQLEALHIRGYVHLDIRQANIMSGPKLGYILLTDLGAARLLAAAKASMCTHAMASCRVLALNRAQNGADEAYLPSDDVVSLIYNLAVICHQGLGNLFQSAQRDTGLISLWQARLHGRNTAWSRALKLCSTSDRPNYEAIWMSLSTEIAILAPEEIMPNSCAEVDEEVSRGGHQSLV